MYLKRRLHVCNLCYNFNSVTLRIIYSRRERIKPNAHYNTTRTRALFCFSCSRAFYFCLRYRILESLFRDYVIFVIYVMYNVHRLCCIVPLVRFLGRNTCLRARFKKALPRVICSIFFLIFCYSAYHYVHTYFPVHEMIYDSELTAISAQ